MSPPPTAMATEAPEAPQSKVRPPAREWKKYKADLKTVWCPGCGDFGVTNAIYHALAELELPPEMVTVVSGIGCSGRVSGYVATYGFHGVHGRVLPLAQGVKLANPELTVIAAGGDGDGLSIGAGHFPHAARRNMDITYIMFDNHVYGLTKGQMSPTTPVGDVTPTSLYGGVMDEPIDPISLALVYKASYIARAYSADFRKLSAMIVEAIQHPGFSFIQVLSPCTTFRGKGEFDRIRGAAYYLEDTGAAASAPSGAAAAPGAAPGTATAATTAAPTASAAAHDVTDRHAAFAVAEQTDRIPLGLIYKDTSRPTFQAKAATIQAKAQEGGVPSVEELVAIFEP